MKLSIITINFNNAAGLEKTICSVIEQNFDDFEYIVIDGGSSDESTGIIRKHADCIRYWVSEPDKGIYDAMNKGIRASVGEYILFLNSGDFIINQGILRQVFSAPVTSDILYGELIFDYGEGQEKLESLPDRIDLPFLFNRNIWHPASFIRKKLFDKYGEYDTDFRIAGDYDFFFKVIIREKCTTSFLPFPISVYETTGASSDSVNLPKILLEREKVHRKYLESGTIAFLTYQHKFRIGFIALLLSQITFLQKPADWIYNLLVVIRNSWRSIRVKADITFFTPTFWRTGSEIVLWNLLMNIKGLLKVRLISRYKADPALALPSTVLMGYQYVDASGTIISRLKKVFRRVFIVPLFYFFNRGNPWYINTIALPGVLRKAEAFSVKVILHVHELEQMFARLKEDEIQRVLNYPSLLIANSQTTKSYLQSLGCKVPVEVIYPAFDTSRFKRSKEDYTNFRSMLGIHPDEFVWVMCGTLDPNKNGILFLNTAAEILKSHPATTFLWLGSTPDISYKKACEQHAVNLGITRKVLWHTPEFEQYVRYLNCADGFMLTSVRESFSMVTVEALLLGLPVVAQDCGGVSEILEEETGVIVKELNNPAAMALPMLEFMKGIRKLNQLKAKQKAESFDIAIWAPRWKDMLLKTLKF
jgi:glycosyltransferase involved in cell wall biosynthesis